MQNIGTALILILMVGIILFVIYRTNQNALNRILRGERTLDDREIFMRNSPPMPATVLQKKETINPKAKGVAKVDLEMEIRVPEAEPMRVNTTWLVEIPNLSDLEVGKEVQVKFDPKKPKRVYPAVPWARLWLFD